MYPISPVNTILVQFDKKYQDEIITEGGLKLFKDTSYNPEWNVTVTGKVVAVPQRLSKTIVGANGELIPDKFHTRITPDVKIGDELFFSYRVVEDKSIRKDSDAFMEQSPTESPNKIFTNGLKEKLQLQHLSKKVAIALWTDANDQLLAGCQGTPKECEKWMMQFRFAGEDQTVFTNLLWHEDQDYWMVDYLEAIAVKRNGEIIMIAGNVLCEPQEESLVYERGPDMVLHLVKKIDKGVLKVVAVGKPLKDEPELGLKPGDTIKVIQSHVQKYELWGQQYTIIEQKSILGKI